MELERKIFDAASFKAVDAAQGIAEMVVSVFHNVDEGGEVVLPGFFAESIARRQTPDGRPKAKGVWGHDWLTPIAKTLEARELPPGDPALPGTISQLGGLFVRGQFNLDTQRGREAFSDLSFGAIDEFSIGYQVAQDRFDPTAGVRYLLKGEWYEWSPVLVGMNSATALIGVKGHGLSLEQHTEHVRVAVQELLHRIKSGSDLRAKEGRAISSARRERIASMRDSLHAHADELDALLKETEPQKAADPRALFLDFQKILATHPSVARGV